MEFEGEGYEHFQQFCSVIIPTPVLSYAGSYCYCVLIFSIIRHQRLLLWKNDNTQWTYQ